VPLSESKSLATSQSCLTAFKIVSNCALLRVVPNKGSIASLFRNLIIGFLIASQPLLTKACLNSGPNVFIASALSPHS